MTFADYIRDIFTPCFEAVGSWFQQLLDKTGFLGVFISTVVLTIAFSALVVPFLGFGGLSLVRSGTARVESKRAKADARKAQTEAQNAWYKHESYRAVSNKSGGYSMRHSVSYSRSRRL